MTYKRDGYYHVFIMWCISISMVIIAITQTITGVTMGAYNAVLMAAMFIVLGVGYKVIFT